ncbi:MAG: NGG1p interacting factor NIF3 [Nitrospirae bacterium]|nr:MAG: NGG1p interacting factor NIF3 [Nitrospirota bacterium]
MTVKEIYQRAVQVGMENDPRGMDTVKKELEDAKKRYDEMKEKEREFFDTESLTNPYSDTRILSGTGEEEVKTIIAGIDIEVGEIVLADHLRNKGRNIDLVVSHHPEGMAFANLYDVMKIQSDILHRFGVPINIAESLMEGRIKEVERRLMPVNHNRAVDAARLLGLPFLCLHTPADNMVATYLQRLFDEKKPYRISDLIDMLMEIPEYREAMKVGAGPKVLLGSERRKVGRVFVDMTGGTEGAKEIFSSLTQSGVNTVVAMHLSEEHRKEAEKNHLNVVIAGHIASDNLGLNLLFDRVLDSSVEVIEVSGFKRVSRV